MSTWAHSLTHQCALLSHVAAVASVLLQRGARVLGEGSLAAGGEHGRRRVRVLLDPVLDAARDSLGVDRLRGRERVVRQPLQQHVDASARLGRRRDHRVQTLEALEAEACAKVVCVRGA